MSIQCLKCEWLTEPGNMGLWWPGLHYAPSPNSRRRVLVLCPNGNEFLGPSEMFG